ncbi:MAG: hypothetical protein HY928_02145 [Elusimicrobia bacterium]|nr:hypothetical protein [Elusimicrobiota bacterium]
MSLLPLCLLVCLPAAARQWPSAPAPARLESVGEFYGPRRAEPTGGWGRLVRALLGVESLPAGAHRKGGLAQPTGLAARGGFVWVADPGAKGLFRFEEATGAGVWLPRGGDVRLESPVAVAAAPDGRVFVADSALRKVFILDAEGKVTGELRGAPAGLGRPVGLALSKERLYVSDAAQHRVAMYDLKGVFLAAVGARGKDAGEFNFPTYLWFDAKADRLLVCDSGNFRVQRLKPDGSPDGSVGHPGNRPGYLARPRGVALDSDGNLYVVDGAFEAFQLFDAEGRLLMLVGSAGNGPGEFSLPGGIAIDAADRIFVADTFNSRVQMFRYLKGVQP